MSDTMEELEGDVEIDDITEWESLLEQGSATLSQTHLHVDPMKKNLNSNSGKEQLAPNPDTKLKQNISLNKNLEEKVISDVQEIQFKSKCADQPLKSKMNTSRETTHQTTETTSEKKDIAQNKSLPSSTKSAGFSDLINVFTVSEKAVIKTQPSVSQVTNSPHPSANRKHKLPSEEQNIPKTPKIDGKSELRKTDVASDTLTTSGKLNPKICNKSSEEASYLMNSHHLLHGKKSQEDYGKESPSTNLVKKTSHVLTEAEWRNVEGVLVDEMMEEVKNHIISTQGDKYFVRISPVELADLAELSVQELIASQPNLTFYLKRQGKFKKKKGYAESYFTMSQDVQTFVQKVFGLKLVESKVEVMILYHHGRKDPEILSFTALLDKSTQLCNLAKNIEDLTRSRKEKIDCCHVENLPTSPTTLLLKTLFPFSKSVCLPVEKSTDKNQCYRGAASVYYNSRAWIEAVLSCCTDFTYRSKPLQVVYKNNKLKPEIDGKNDNTWETKREGDLDAKKEGIVGTEKATSCSANGAHQNFQCVNSEINDEPDVDADISSMTLDLCTGMLESLSKLKELGTDNPEVLKILEMQTQLATLQQSLSKTSTASSVKDASDPWMVGPSDTLNGTKPSESSMRKLSKREKRKQEEERRAMKQLKEIEELQRMIDDADEAERQRQKKLQQEQQKVKEEKSKLNWAKKMIEEAKQSGSSLTSDSSRSAATKQEAQRMLKAREDRLREEGEAKKKEEAMKNSVPAIKPECIKLETDIICQKQEPEKQTNIGTDTPSTSAQLELQPEDKKNNMTTPGNAISISQEPVVLTENEYSKLLVNKSALPAHCSIQLSFYPNRQCPVVSCPTTKIFKSAATFMDHWDIFHKPYVTMRFCSKCSAYFMNVPELESHLIKRHYCTDPKEVNKLIEQVRIKVVSNPSYRDPGIYLGPVR